VNNILAALAPLLLAAALLTLSGCALGPNEPGWWGGGRPVPDEPRQVTDLIAYAQRVAASPAEQQRREFDTASQAYAVDRAWPNRLRLALLLSMPGAPFEDDVRALSVLEPLAESAQPSPTEQLGAFLHAQVSARLREQRRANQMKDQMETLRNQLEALKAVEKSIIQRDQRRGR